MLPHRFLLLGDGLRSASTPALLGRAVCDAMNSEVFWGDPSSRQNRLECAFAQHYLVAVADIRACVQGSKNIYSPPLARLGSVPHTRATLILGLQGDGRLHSLNRMGSS